MCVSRKKIGRSSFAADDAQIALAGRGLMNNAG